MAGAQFQYDKSGGTSYYFITTFFALVLVPFTYYFWPKRKKQVNEIIEKCHCNGCQLKFNSINAIKPKNEIKNVIIKLALIAVWLVFLYVSYHAAKFEKDFNEYDPYAILELDRGAPVIDIKKKYRQLSALYHPDVKDSGDSVKFMKIAKAYAALTDEESRKNWEEYGNPDGPGATQFGIALPAWIVEKGNSIWVLSAYVLVFMIILPVIVGTWWYKSIKYSGDKVLLDTTQMYMYFFHKTPNMILRRVLMILAASFEFCKFYNTEVQERPSDNVELPQLLKTLTNLNEKNKEKPLSAPYSVKARILIHAHLTRLELPALTLEQDKQYILKKCPILLNEMVTCVAQLMAFANSGRIQHSPKLETMENIMKTSQMIIQALWDFKNPLLQLPHVGEDILKHCINKKYMVRNIRDLASMKESDRRSLLSKLSEREYADIMFILSMMPSVDMDIVTKVIDDEDPNTITANSIVTVTVTLHRKSLGSSISQNDKFSNDYNAQQQLTNHGTCNQLLSPDQYSHVPNGILANNPQEANPDNEQAPEDDETITGARKQPSYKPKKKNISKSMAAKQKAQKKKCSQQNKAKPLLTNETNPDDKIKLLNDDKTRTESISSSTSLSSPPNNHQVGHQGDLNNSGDDESSVEGTSDTESKNKSNPNYQKTLKVHGTGEQKDRDKALNDESRRGVHKNEREDESEFSDASLSSASSDSSDIYSSQEDRPGIKSKRKEELRQAMELATLEQNDGYDSCDSVGNSHGLKHQIAPLAKPKTLPKNAGSKIVIKESKTEQPATSEISLKPHKHKRDVKSPKTKEENEMADEKPKSPKDDNDDDELWDEDFQKTLRKHEKQLFDGSKNSETFEVHCPFFPEKKYERWWLYMADRKHSTLITAPIYVTSLKESEEFNLKFPAPPKPGVYAFSVVLRSDSYLDCDFTKIIKLDVKEEKVMDENHPQWDISETEKEEDEDPIEAIEEETIEDSEENDSDSAHHRHKNSKKSGGLFGASSFFGATKAFTAKTNKTSKTSDKSDSEDVENSDQEKVGKEDSSAKIKKSAADKKSNTKSKSSKKAKNLSDMEYTTEEESSDDQD